MTDQERLEEIQEQFDYGAKNGFEDYNVALADIKWLISTVVEQQKLIAHWKKGFENENKIAGRLRKKFERLEKENARLQKTLEFYADKKTYETNVTDQWEPITPIDQDQGDKARRELGE
ncbi:hypothetical protein J14TS2_44900 [Bacillus sp. J14TS2]|uniref:hypothetical protein n=1 Tax=Bacillus sp. J14TS2 TaxID=2807188 RepID=UPI001B20DC80|nr:hypothetical protein [Bacillus sp. J14TS2]GIN74015.1 hypothetical protein J14TS2_44900 [Bacillus sp. J14TS2]